MIVLGVMSGTSGDGVDLALVEFDLPAKPVPVTGRLLAFHCQDYPPDMRQLILSVANATTLAQAQHMAQSLGGVLDAYWIQSAMDFLERAGHQADLVCSHGQTLYHAPREGVSYQWDNPALWRHSLSCPVVTDVRMADVRAGGQGAPLAPLLHAALYRSKAATTVVANVGGMANVTIIPPLTNAALSWDHWSTGIQGWDTGPGNALLDALVKARTQGQLQFDAGGELALAGHADMGLVEVWCASEPWFAVPPPKSTGRDRFGHAFAQTVYVQTAHLTLQDAAATVSELTIQSLSRSVRAARIDTPIEALQVCGGGSHNHYLLRRWSEELSCPVYAVKQADAIEAWLMAMIGFRTWHGLPSSIVTVTGAMASSVLGAIQSFR